jgi:hypothetical protein
VKLGAVLNRGVQRKREESESERASEKKMLTLFLAAPPHLSLLPPCTMASEDVLTDAEELLARWYGSARTRPTEQEAGW